MKNAFKFHVLIVFLKTEALAKEMNTQYIECSAKTNANITEVFHMAADLIINHRKGGFKMKTCTLL